MPRILCRVTTRTRWDHPGAKLEGRGAAVLAWIGVLTLLTAAAAAPRVDLQGPAVESAAALRFKGIVRQQSDHTCGYAAAATVLRSLGLPVDEASLVGTADRRGEGASVAAIGRAVAPWGVRSYAVESTWEKLSAYFERYREPVLVLVDVGRPHFTVVLDVDPGAVYLADPSQGYRSLSRRAFERRWTGVVVFLRRHPEQVPAAGAVQADLVQALLLLQAVRHRLLRMQPDLGLAAVAGRMGL